MLYLVHHSQAVAPDIDPQRPLTPSGVELAERVARELSSRSVKPAAIHHSGKLRARHTAEILWRLCNPLAEFSAIRGLRPDDPPNWIADVVRAEERELMLVGHMPQLPRLLGFLTGGNSAAYFPMHGVVALERDGEGGWTETWRIEGATGE